MTPLEFLQEEQKSVDRALKETLRREYADSQHHDFYTECSTRLARVGIAIDGIQANDSQAISSNLTELNKIAAWISLNERSYLGEFSWPFAQELRNFAMALLKGVHFDANKQSPIIQIISESSYLILNEALEPQAVADQCFVVIQFPRSLKYHVLLHAIFGHELGHAAWDSPITGDSLKTLVSAPLFDAGPLSGVAAMDAWLRRKDAPEYISKVASLFDPLKGEFIFKDEFRKKWQVEFVADLCGLVLFGPAFAAAFIALLKAKHPQPMFINLADPTHPPFACRLSAIQQAMKILGWDRAITPSSNERLRHSERDLLTYIFGASAPAWAQIFTVTQIQDALQGIRSVFGENAYAPPEFTRLDTLVERLVNITPPVLADVRSDGTPELSKIPFTQMLYAGWVFWIGRGRFNLREPVTFFDINRLCNHAMIQQQAINMFAP